jgi:predicted permease
VERLIQDIRFAVRRLIRTPAFTLVALASLAVGIGANTAIFSLVNAVILRDVPFDDPEELVHVYRSVAGFSHATWSYPDFQDVIQETQDVFEGVSGSRIAFVQTDVDAGIEMEPAEIVSGNYFTLAGIDAVVGRTLLPEDDVSPDGHPVVVLSYGFWQERFGGAPDAVGQDIRLNGRNYRVVGVAPKEYTGNLRGLAPSFYAPMMMVAHLNPTDSNELENRSNSSTFLKARMLPGVTFSQVQATGDRLAVTFRERYPDEWQADNVVTMVRESDVIMNPMIDRFIVAGASLMMVVVALVLLIACANLGSFLLAQAADRRKEIAIRLAMGAPRGRLIRQLMTESLLLSLIGGAAGVYLAVLLLKGLVAADLPLPFPIELDLSIDRTVLAFTTLATVAAAVLFGLAPALQATNPDVTPTLKDEGTGGGRPKRVTLRGALVVTQVAVSLMLLVGAGLFMRSLQARMAVDPGFGYEPAGILTIMTPPQRYSEEESRVFMRTYLDELVALPGVTAVGMTDDLHLSTLNNSMMGVQVDGVEPPPGQDYHLIDASVVDEGFFEAAGVSIVQGRNFADTDEADAPPVAIVSQAMAARFWPGEEALGRRFRQGEEEYTVIGVARDAKVRSLGEAPRPFVYRFHDQHFRSFMTVVAQTTGDPARTTLEMLSVGRRMDPELMVVEQKTMERHIGVMLVAHRLSAGIISAFGLLALLLASLGLYGVVSYAVSTRSREVGIRMSLGAEPRSVVGMLMKGGMRLVIMGAVIGLVLSFLGARLLSGLLYGVEATDPVSFLCRPSGGLHPGPPRERHQSGGRPQGELATTGPVSASGASARAGGDADRRPGPVRPGRPRTRMGAASLCDDPIRHRHSAGRRTTGAIRSVAEPTSHGDTRGPLNRRAACPSPRI